MIDLASQPAPTLSRTDRASPASRAVRDFDLSPRLRRLVAIVAAGLTGAAIIALFRGMTGIAPYHPNIRELAILIHVAAVLPAIPLGGYLLLAPKGGALHKRLGKVWVALMVTTALSAVFIRWGGGLDFHFSAIHVFVPMTLIASWKLVAAARRGDMKKHRGEILALYLGALTIPGLVAFLMPGRMMHVWLFG